MEFKQTTTVGEANPNRQLLHEEFPLNLEIPLLLGIFVGVALSGIVTKSMSRALEEESQVKLDLSAQEKSPEPQKILEAVNEDLNSKTKTQPLNSQIEFYDWENIAKEAVGIIVAGNSGSAKTCLTTWLLGKLTQTNPAQILVLDPHANRNPLWEELGITSVSDFALIEDQLCKLEELLDARRNQPENGDTVITVAEELGACIKNFSDSDRVQRTLERLGSEGRKYGLVLISVNTSSNCLDLGISGQSRNNFVTLLCGATSRDYAARTWKKNDKRAAWVHNTAYPLVLAGAVPGCVAVHPTHGHHKEYAILGKEPKGILPVNQLPLTIPLVSVNDELNISDNAKKLLKWFEDKTTVLDDSYNLRSIAQSKPLGRNTSHKFEILIPLLDELQQAELVIETEDKNYRLIT